MKYAIITILWVLCLTVNSEAMVVTCEFKTLNWTYVGNLYTCQLQNSFDMVTKEMAVVDSFTATPSQEVKGFYAMYKPIYYFPRNLEAHLPNLEAVQMWGCNLKEIKREDLKPFPKLRLIALGENDIEMLEEGLFDFNPLLEFIYLNFNKISQIEVEVFDNLHNLRFLTLSSNTCISSVGTDAEEIKILVNEVKSKCPGIVTTNHRIRPLISEMESMIKAEINKVQTQMESKLKTTKEELIRQMTSLEEKVSTIEGLVNKVIDMIKNK